MEAVFNAILSERMAGLPVVNTALAVEAVGFQAWEGHWLGVLITPWFLNLLIVPKAGSPWPQQFETGKGKEVVLAFPQGEYKFSPRREESIGSYLSCSLASPVHEWKAQAEIRRTAEDVLQLLKSIPVRAIEPEQAATDNGQEQPASQGCALSRRAFLGGAGAAG
nr:[NiFe]-hydrogenase assembly chaperone HybE [Motiliproteus sp. SC1-56]